MGKQVPFQTFLETCQVHGQNANFIIKEGYYIRLGGGTSIVHHRINIMPEIFQTCCQQQRQSCDFPTHDTIQWLEKQAGGGEVPKTTGPDNQVHRPSVADNDIDKILEQNCRVGVGISLSAFKMHQKERVFAKRDFFTSFACDRHCYHNTTNATCCTWTPVTLHGHFLFQLCGTSFFVVAVEEALINPQHSTVVSQYTCGFLNPKSQ